MKYLLTLLLISANVCFAQPVVVTPKTAAAATVVNESTMTNNPDRRRVAGSAMILKTDGVIDDATIPKIETPESDVPSNVINPPLPELEFPKLELSIID
jgi:hypothetical protein